MSSASLLKCSPAWDKKMVADEIRQKNQMTEGYLISSRALEIGVRLRCQRLNAAFIALVQKLIRSAILKE